MEASPQIVTLTGVCAVRLGWLALVLSRPSQRATTRRPLSTKIQSALPPDSSDPLDRNHSENPEPNALTAERRRSALVASARDSSANDAAC